MTMAIENAQSIRAFLKEEAILAHPVLDHPLRGEDSYTRELYVVTLCAAAQYGGLITENRSAFLKRLLCSLRMEEPLAQYARLASQIEEKTVAEFLKVLCPGGQTLCVLPGYADPGRLRRPAR